MQDIATVMLLTGALLAGATIVYYWLQDRWSAYQHGLDRCNCGLHDLTDLEAQHTEVAVHSRGLCQPRREWIAR